MTRCANLWAVGFDDADRAARLRDEIAWLGWDKQYLNILNLSVAVRYPDGTLAVNGERYPILTNVVGHPLATCLVGLALGAPPMTGAAVTAVLSEIGVYKAATGIGDDFVRELAGLIRPGTSILFLLDDGGDLDAILPEIRGMGGTVLKTNVDLERAKRVQAALAASADATRPLGHPAPSGRSES